MQLITKALNGAIELFTANDRIELHVQGELHYSAATIEKMQQALASGIISGLCELYLNECKRIAERLDVTFNDAVPTLGDPSQTVKNMWGIEVKGGMVGAIWFCAHTVPCYLIIINRRELGTYPTLADAQQATREFYLIRIYYLPMCTRWHYNSS